MSSVDCRKTAIEIGKRVLIAVVGAEVIFNAIAPAVGFPRPTSQLVVAIGGAFGGVIFAATNIYRKGLPRRRLPTGTGSVR
jgi:hypothetical protein